MLGIETRSLSLARKPAPKSSIEMARFVNIFTIELVLGKRQNNTNIKW